MVVWLAAGSAPAAAQLSAEGEGYALLVGSNRGGAGQATLRYAEDDTRRVADVLTSLGGYRAEHVQRLLHPTAQELLAALETVRAHVEPLSKRGIQSRFFFYYSGHARADALNLGDEPVPLPDLRARIEQLPATLSIVVLDACQSGAFSRAKGAAAAGDFSFNSVNRLNTAGMAVIASSNERELSQESDVLGSSYFTHHWLVGLRGAGDDNRDGRVTLSEAYQYAYNHTLANTAQTAVGEQHATLETNLRGQDDVALTQPSAASARLQVPGRVRGRLLLQALPSWSVLAELDKVPGHPVVLALPPGEYAATLRQGDTTARCVLRLRDGAELSLNQEQCTVLEQQVAAAKGAMQSRSELRAERLAERRAQRAWEDAQDAGKSEHFSLNVALGFGFVAERDAYTSRLREFGFEHHQDDVGVRVAVDAGYRLSPHFVLGLGYFNLAPDRYQRFESTDQDMSWAGHALTGFIQADVAYGRRRFANFFVKLGAGASWAWTHLDAFQVGPDFASSTAIENTTAHVRSVRQDFVRPCGFVSGGMQFTFSRYVGATFELRYVLAPGLRNELGEHRNLGGIDLLFGVRMRTWE